MPRGKNYVNNNRGVCLQASEKGKQSIKQCEYGSACNRSDCIYRHDNMVISTDEICFQFLAGTCAFTAGGCRKRHPKNDEKGRLLGKYKRTRCHYGDDCHTEGCLYLHPREMKPVEPSYVEPTNMDMAFPALGGGSSSANTPAKSTPKLVTEPLPASPWNSAPMQQQSQPIHQPSSIPIAPAWFPQDPSFAPFCTPTNQEQESHCEYGGEYDYANEGHDYANGGYDYGDGSGYAYAGYNNDVDGYDMGAQGAGDATEQMSATFNAGAKEFVPGGFLS